MIKAKAFGNSPIVPSHAFGCFYKLESGTVFYCATLKDGQPDIGNDGTWNWVEVQNEAGLKEAKKLLAAWI